MRAINALGKIMLNLADMVSILGGLTNGEEIGDGGKEVEKIEDGGKEVEKIEVS